MCKGAAKVELSAIIVNDKIEPPGLSGFMCISGGKKVWILQKYLKFAVNV